MFKSILDVFKGSPSAPKQTISLELAAAALLVEVMAADDEWQASEADRVCDVLVQSLAIDMAQARELLDAARDHQQAAHDLYEITRLINDNYSAEQKYQLIVNMWKVAYADGNLDRYEDHTIRKIAELLYVPHVQFIQAKLAVQPNG